MIENKNALAELAAELKRSLDLQMPGTSYYRDRTVFCTPEVIDKSMRIVAELAKVEDRHDGETNSDVLWRCNDCIAKCRAIAEEGANNGK